MSCAKLCSLCLVVALTKCVAHGYTSVAPQACLNVLNVVVGFVAMSRVNLPVFLCLRRTVIMFVVVGEMVFLAKRHSQTVL